MGITNFTVSFEHEGKRYTFDASKINRNLADGSGNKILAAKVYDEDGRSGVCNLTTDWRIVSLYME